MNKCRFCGGVYDLYKIENINLCGRCRRKLKTHIAVVCTGCDTPHWLPKTANNVVTAAEMSGVAPERIKANYCIHRISRCKSCYEHVADFTHSAQWVQ